MSCICGTRRGKSKPKEASLNCEGVSMKFILISENDIVGSDNLTSGQQAVDYSIQ